MGLVLKVREHGLAVEGGADVVQTLAQKQGLFVFIGGVVKEPAAEKLLIEGRGHLGAENAVIGIEERLGLIAEPGVHGVPQLMGQGKHVIQGSGEVQKHIRLAAVSAGGIGPRALGLPGIHVNPALIKGPLHQPGVILPQHCGGLQHHLLRLFIGVFPGGFLHQGHKQITEIEGIQPQALLAEGHILVEGLHIGPDGFQQIVVDLFRNVVGVEGGGSSTGIPAGFSGKAIVLHGAIVDGCQGIDVLLIGAQQALVVVPAESGVGIFQSSGIIGLVGPDFFPFQGVYQGKLHVVYR